MHSSFYWLLPVALGIVMLRFNAAFVKSVSGEYDMSAADDLLLMASPMFCSIMSLATWVVWAWVASAALFNPLLLTGLAIWMSTSVVMFGYKAALIWPRWHSDSENSNEMQSHSRAVPGDFQTKIAA